MKFSLFARESAHSEEAPLYSTVNADTEFASLTASLHGLLESLPQSYSGRENIKLLCDAILGATPHLRFVWVGFHGGNQDGVAPYAAAGDCASESDDWRLPSSCFAANGPFAQAITAQAEPDDYTQLFSPWRANPCGCSVDSALAIPLRSEKTGLRGMIVFYADTIDYFRRTGVPVFQAFCHVAEIIWKQSNLTHMATQHAQQDSLTGLMSRRYTIQVLEKAIAEAELTEQPLSILICRLEGFGKLNDLYGWMATDAILAAFSKDIGLQLRAHDKGGRWTGTEFLYILPNTSKDQAEQLAVSLREYFLVNPVNVKSWSVRLAVMAGIANYSRRIIGVDDLIQHAKQSMAAAVDELPSSMS